MAGLSPSPAGHNYADDELAWGQQSLSPVPSPLEASRTNNEAGLRQSASSPRESAQHVCFAPRDSHSGNPLAASKPSSNSLASNPSHASFASTQTESSVGLTPDNITFGSSSHSAVASTGHPHASAVGPDAFGTSPSRTSRRIKRLERNRESARLSRKRRKAYLEELEAKVHMLSGRMDRERVAFALGFLGEVRRRYGAGSMDANSSGVQRSIGTGIKHNLHHTISDGDASNQQWDQRPTRIPHSLRIIYTFQHQYLSSLVLSKESKFILWLMIQREVFWRGGRGSSERLSAARIGEKVRSFGMVYSCCKSTISNITSTLLPLTQLLHNGTYKASPSDSMWPLFCHEVGLSYEQEDRVRSTQRSILADTKTWIHRHTAAATKNVLDSTQHVISGMYEAAKKREEAILNVLTLEQRHKLCTWVASKSTAMRQLQVKLAQLNEADEYTTTPQRHVAANMYIIDHRLSNIKSRLHTKAYIHPSQLKNLSRRPSFESLAGQDAPEPKSKLSREASFPSTGSLKRNLDEMTGDDNYPTTNSHSGITVESAHAAAQPAVRKVFDDILPIVPEGYHAQMHLQHFRPTSVTATNQNSFSAPSPIQSGKTLHAKSCITKSISNQPQCAAPQSSDDIDIPMPTPVSVLRCTQDEFLDVETTSGVPTEVTSAMQQPLHVGSAIEEPLQAESGYIPSIEYAPEPIVSSRFSRSYASAPQLYSANEYDYPSLMYSNPHEMMPVPEEQKINSVENVEEDGFDLEELGNPHDWAIGESFDMDLDVPK